MKKKKVKFVGMELNNGKWKKVTKKINTGETIWLVPNDMIKNVKKIKL